jgi:hypothetical protein
MGYLLRWCLGEVFFAFFTFSLFALFTRIGY